LENEDQVVLSLTFAVALAVALVPWAFQPFGQEVTANIVGTVTDPQRRTGSGCGRRSYDVDRGTVWNATTNDAGAYNLLRLPIGSYTLKVTAPGFQTVTRVPLPCAQQTARVDAQLKVGQVSETVEVIGSAPVLQTESTEVSTLINAHTNTSLPLASRNYLQLTLLAPGTTTVNPESLRNPQNMLGSGRPYINGNRDRRMSI